MPDFAAIETAKVNHRFKRQTEVDLVHTLLQNCDAWHSVQEIGPFKLPAERWVETEDAVPEGCERPSQLLGALDPAVPIGHGEDEQIEAASWWCLAEDLGEPGAEWPTGVLPAV